MVGEAGSENKYKTKLLWNKWKDNQTPLKILFIIFSNSNQVTQESETQTKLNPQLSKFSFSTMQLNSVSFFPLVVQRLNIKLAVDYALISMLRNHVNTSIRAQNTFTVSSL